MRDGIAFPVSWFEIVFNPSFPYRFAHMLVAVPDDLARRARGGCALPAVGPLSRAGQ
jgi:hypothetical protein